MRFLLMGGWLPLAMLGLSLAVLACVGASSADQAARTRWTNAARVMWLLALIGVGFLTLWLTNPDVGGVNLVPFETIRRQLEGATWLALFNIGGNLLVLVPFGLLARPAFGWSWAKTSVAAVLFCTAIEIVQGQLGRAVDIDDVILNSLGATVGAFISWLIVVVVRRLQPAPAAT